jgi:hypothetical protein
MILPLVNNKEEEIRKECAVFNLKCCTRVFLKGQRLGRKGYLSEQRGFEPKTSLIRLDHDVSDVKIQY